MFQSYENFENINIKHQKLRLVVLGGDPVLGELIILTFNSEKSLETSFLN